jgi:hypothetical protein
MDLRESGWGGVWSGFTWLRIGIVGGLLWMRWWTFGLWRHGLSYVCVSFLLLQAASEMATETRALCRKKKEQRGEHSSWDRYAYAVLIPRILFAYQLLPKCLRQSSVSLISLISREGSFSLPKAWFSATR